jgi:hypothetical protein
MQKKSIIIISLIVGLLITLSSAFYVRNYIAVTGNVCEVSEENPNGFCYDELPMVGLPLAYLKDSPGVSVIGSLNLGEDDLKLSFFIIDWLIFSSIIGFVLFLIRKHKR